MAGFEPTNARVKVWCLTAWRHPIIWQGRVERRAGGPGPCGQSRQAGVGAKIFTVAGPVLLYGTAAGTLYGVIYWIVGRFL